MLLSAHAMSSCKECIQSATAYQSSCILSIVAVPVSYIILLLLFLFALRGQNCSNRINEDRLYVRIQ